MQRSRFKGLKYLVDFYQWRHEQTFQTSGWWRVLPPAWTILMCPSHKYCPGLQYSVGTFQWHLPHMKESHTFDQVSQAAPEHLAMKQQAFPSSRGRLLISFSTGFCEL